MKITDVKVVAVREARTFLFVAVETDEGVTGLGEAGLTGREQAVAGMIEHLKPLVVGEDPSRTEHLWQTLWRGGFFPAGQVLSAAIAAIDIALWDIKAKALGVPLYELLGGRVRDRVLTYCHIHGRDSGELLAAGKAAAAKGWKVIRFEPYADEDGLFEPRRALDRAVEEFASLRAELGDEIELCFDAHTRLPVPDAIRFCRQVEPYRPFFVEDPARAEHPQAYRRIRAQTAVPLAAGEQFATKWEFRSLIEEELIDYARIDLCIAGGITEARKIAGWCETHMIDIAVHNPIGPVSTAACLHFNMACPNMAVQELPRLPGDSLPDLITGQPRWADGWLLPPEGPGLGVEIDLSAVDKYPFEASGLPILHREDGSFTNW